MTAAVGDGEGTEVGVLGGVAVACGVEGGGYSLSLFDELEQAVMANTTNSAEINRTVGLCQGGNTIEAVDTRLNLRKLQLALSTHHRTHDQRRDCFVAS